MLPTNTNSAAEYVRYALSPKHLTDLKASGLTDETIQRLGFRTETDAFKNGDALGLRPAHILGPCLILPFFDLDDVTLADYVRLKPDCPFLGKDGKKKAKYVSPKGKPNRLYLPANTRRQVLADPSIDLLITEGEKKSAKADQEGFPCLGLVGVYGWMQKMERNKEGRAVGKRKLIVDFAPFAFFGRKVYIAYDSDLANNPNVLWAEYHLGKALQKEGAEVTVIRIPPRVPPGPEGDKQGLDDFLVAHGPDALRKLIAEAQPLSKPKNKPKEKGKELSGVDLIQDIVKEHELLYNPSDRSERFIYDGVHTLKLSASGDFYDHINNEYFTRSGKCCCCHCCSPS